MSAGVREEAPPFEHMGAGQFSSREGSAWTTSPAFQQEAREVSMGVAETVAAERQAAPGDAGWPGLSSTRAGSEVLSPESERQAFVLGSSYAARTWGSQGFPVRAVPSPPPPLPQQTELLPKKLSRQDYGRETDTQCVGYGWQGCQQGQQVHSCYKITRRVVCGEPSC